MLKASFIIPTKNSGKFIEQCLSSLMPYYEQGYIEDIVVVDAFSTDDTIEKARRFPVKVLPDPSRIPNMTFAFEIGWREAAGDPIVFFDSDAYLGEDFLPKLFTFLQDDEVGMVGCGERPVVANNRVSIAIGQWKAYTREALFSPKGLGRVHHWVSTRKKPMTLPLPGGPCHVVRRNSIEAVDGYRGVAYRIPPDEALSKRILRRGWKARWWQGSPVYHHTRATLKSLLRQYAHDGRNAALLHQQKEFKQNALHKAIYIAGHLGTPLEGLTMAVRWRNPIHIFLYPLAHYTFVLGYLSGLIPKGRPEEQIP